MGFAKIAAGLPGVLGKTIAGAFLVEYARGHFRVILTFTDGTHYELYGDGTVSGSRSIEDGGTDDVRRTVTDDAALQVVEISPEMMSRARGRG